MFDKRLLTVFLCLFIAPLFAGDNQKVDARIYEMMNGRAALQSPAQDGIRVVIQLAQQEGVTSRDSDGSTALAASVMRSQDAFLLNLQDVGLLNDGNQRAIDGKFTGFRTELLLDYQHAVAGYINDEATLEALASRADVLAVELDNLNEMFTVEGRQLTGSDVVAAAGYAGNGMGVAVIDSNFDLLHPELGGSTSLPNGVVYGGYNYSSNNTQIHSQVFGDCYHGTGTASIVRRYATSSDLYTLVVFPNSYDSVIANAINWCVTNKNGVNGGDPIKVISMSLGGGSYSGTCNTGLMHTAAGNALSNGILVVAATGNEGNTSTISSPACSSNVIAIGSVWDENNAAYAPFSPAYCSDSNRLEDERACYSNKSAQLDLYAPSEEVICAQCGGGTFALGGTSSATPAAAGMIAQLLSYDSSLSGDKSGVVSLLQSTGASVSGHSGKYRIDLAAATAGSSSCTNYSGYLTGTNDTEAEPDGTYYYVSSSGTHTGDLVGPTSSSIDFDLELLKWNGSGWATVASSTSSNSNESISYAGTSGYYYWRVKSYQGSGSYTLCIDHP